VTKKVYYEKQGRRYVEVGEYDGEFLDRVPNGATLIIKRENSTMRRYKVDPDFISLLAAATMLEDQLSKLILEASKARPEQRPITPEQRDAWQAFADSMGQSLCLIRYSSCRDIAANILEIIAKKAEGTAKDNPFVEDARQSYITAVQLAINHQDEDDVDDWYPG
jgi:hypothetical protein